MTIKQALILQVAEAWGMTETEATWRVEIALETILASIWMHK